MHHRSRTPKLLGAAVAVVLGLGVGVPPAFAGPAGEPAADADPVPGLVAGTDTTAPQLVTGVDEPAPGADAAEAARAHLAAHRDRYRVDPAQLVVTGVERSADSRRTVRFEQRHGGLPVFGAAYLVHLAGEGDAQRVESVGGKYFTGLTAPTTQAVPDEVLRGLALASVEDGPARTGVTAEDRGPVVLPGGAGRLARHFTVRGTDRTMWEGKARELYLDAGTGTVALSLTSRVPAATGAPAAVTAPAGASTAGLEPAVGTAPDVQGRPTRVNIARLPDGTYQLIDLTRPAPLTVYDAGGRDEYEVGGQLPDGVRPPSSPTPDFPASLAATGAAEAQRNAGAVYDFFHDRLGRDGIDGAGGPVNAVVNVTSGGESLPNAYWSSGRMTYGGGNAKFYPFAVALDVAGHEMTHGVVENTAKLVMRDQSGALDEALADYFGNAVEVTTRGIPMTDPRAALLGESLCRTGTPEACAQRRLDTGRSTVNDYVGLPVHFTEDASHDNSGIMSGALWDIRRTLDPLLADRLVYRALAEYLTPLDTFVDARNAVLAAGRSLGLTRAQLRSVTAAFDAHGIKEGWERRIGMDSRTVLRSLTDGTQNRPDVANGRWVMAAGESGFLGVLTGTVGSSAEPVRLSPVGDKRSHTGPATDGTVAAWASQGETTPGRPDWSVLVRPLDGGATHTVHSAAGLMVSGVRVAGGIVAFEAMDFSTGRTLPWLSVDGAQAAPIALPDGHHGQGLSLRGDLLAWTERWQEGERTVYAPTVYSVSAGKVVARYVAGGTGGTGGTAGTLAVHTLLTAKRLLWLETPLDGSRGTSIRSGALDGSGVTDLLAGSTTEPRQIDELTASEKAVTFAYTFTWPKGRRVANSDLPKLWQLPIDGGTPQRFSCNRGGQYMPVADRGTRVLWADATPGRTDLVMRERAAVTC
ncbi:M4 family metallopeptidase [Streptomyces sp. CB01881]|uniref:M4 family metallopeptidase n=1 Tax=Streptomyces sp. CB01881 TaxID=2078691 RepID=UPI001386E7DC|nr:M4 family metallopeptidase [Streptomyces sp. CB01881]